MKFYQISDLEIQLLNVMAICGGLELSIWPQGQWEALTKTALDGADIQTHGHGTSMIAQWGQFSEEEKIHLVSNWSLCIALWDIVTRPHSNPMQGEYYEIPLTFQLRVKNELFRNLAKLALFCTIIPFQVDQVKEWVGPSILAPWPFPDLSIMWTPPSDGDFHAARRWELLFAL